MPEATVYSGRAGPPREHDPLGAVFVARLTEAEMQRVLEVVDPFVGPVNARTASALADYDHYVVEIASNGGRYLGTLGYGYLTLQVLEKLISALPKKQRSGVANVHLAVSRVLNVERWRPRE